VLNAESGTALVEIQRKSPDRIWEIISYSESRVFGSWEVFALTGKTSVLTTPGVEKGDHPTVS